MVNKPLQLVLLGSTGLVGAGILRFIAQNMSAAVKVNALVRKKSPQPLYDFVTEFEGSLEQIPRDLFPAQPHVVIHFAIKNVDRDGSGFTTVNVMGTKNLLEVIPSSCVGIIYGGSLSDYGQGHQDNIDENTPVCPVTALAKSRIVAEELICETMLRLEKSAYILRPRLILNNSEMTLYRMIKMIKTGISLGSGEQKISVIDVLDYADIIVQLSHNLLKKSLVQAAACSYFNVGYREAISFAQMENTLALRLSLKKSRIKLPVCGAMVHLLNSTRWRKAISIASWIDLMGFTHKAAVGKLEAEIGSMLLSKNPATVFEHIVDELVANLMVGG